MKTFLLPLLILCHTGFSQTELIGSYKGFLAENIEAIIELNIVNTDSLIIKGSGIYPDDQKFTFQGVLQDMNVDNGFISVYKALIQIQMFQDYSNDYEPYPDFIELTFEIEYQTIEDSDGMPEVTENVSSISTSGIWHSLSDMEPENIEFQIIKIK